MDMVRMRLQWEVDRYGHLSSHWTQDRSLCPPVDLSSRRRDPEGSLQRATSYVRQAPAAG